MFNVPIAAARCPIVGRKRSSVCLGPSGLRALSFLGVKATRLLPISQKAREANFPKNEGEYALFPDAPIDTIYKIDYL